MEKFKVGLIRVLTSDDQNFIDIHGKVIMEHYPVLDIESQCIADQPEGIHSKKTFDIAVPKIVTLAKEKFSEKDMILVSCADDPGVEEIRKILPDIPVTGGGRIDSSSSLQVQ
jgi:allantoin racemase